MEEWEIASCDDQNKGKENDEVLLTMKEEETASL